jgi:hypothetical protein
VDLGQPILSKIHACAMRGPDRTGATRYGQIQRYCVSVSSLAARSPRGAGCFFLNVAVLPVRFPEISAGRLFWQQICLNLSCGPIGPAVYQGGAAMFRNALFRDCAHAGEVLAQQLRNVASGDNDVRVPLSRGGVPVGFEIAFLVRKLGLPRRQELAMGAISCGERPERVSHYFYARIADQFDAVLHFDRTTGIEPLPHAEEEQTQQVPETYPVGMIIAIIEENGPTPAFA